MVAAPVVEREPVAGYEKRSFTRRADSTKELPQIFVVAVAERERRPTEEGERCTTVLGCAEWREDILDRSKPPRSQQAAGGDSRWSEPKISAVVILGSRGFVYEAITLTLSTNLLRFQEFCFAFQETRFHLQQTR